MYGRILVAVDETEACRAVLKQAAQLARTLHVDLYVVCVKEYPPVIQNLAMDMQVPDALCEDTFAELKHQARRMVADEGIEIKSMSMVKGDAGKGILGHIEEIGFDLVVLGRRGKGLPHRLRLKSTTHKVMACATCPVVVFPGSSLFVEAIAERLGEKEPT